MPEQSLAVLELRTSTGGYEFAALPPVFGAVYTLATKLVLSRWKGSDFSVLREYQHGSMIQGGLVLKQRSVAHHGLSGTVVFELPCRPLRAVTGDLVRIGSSYTWAPRACFGSGSMGVKLDNGTIVAPGVGGYFQTTGSCVMADLVSQDIPDVPNWTIGKYGAIYYALDYAGALGTESFTYLYRTENWRANQAADGSWYTAAGTRQIWSVSVTWEGAKIICRASTIMNQTLELTGIGLKKGLRWKDLAVATNNADRTQYYSVSSKQPAPSYLSVVSFIDEIKFVQLWMTKPLYENEHTIAYNKALDSYRALSSNNVENALQMAQLQKLLPLDAAKLVSDSKALPPRFRYFSRLKAIALVHLWWKYVVKTTYKDLKELIGALPTLYPKTAAMTLRGEKVQAEREYEYPNQTWVAATARVSPYNLTLLPLRLGVHPGLAQAWDLIPGSFVLDWFFGAADQLAAMDWFVYRSFMKLHWLITSRKTVVTIDATKFGGAGEVTATFYIRSVSLVWPRFLDSIPNPRSVPIKNWAATAAALAISNYKAPGGFRE